jgi:chromosome segregation ATPase
VHDAAPEATKRGKVSSAEELAESMNALPAMLAKMEEAAKVVQAAKESEVSSKDEQIRLLTAQLESANQTIESANQKIARLEAEKSMLMQSNMESMVKAAKAEGAAEQLEANVKMRERQLESWVSRRLSLASHHADLCLCEEDGSVVPPR